MNVKGPAPSHVDNLNIAFDGTSLSIIAHLSSVQDFDRLVASLQPFRELLPEPEPAES